MNEANSFPPVAAQNSRMLILGSMPSRVSLQQQQYYAHPRNAFWTIMGTMIGFSAKTPYEQRLQMITAHQIALWDVLKTCSRPGSLDSSIEETSIVVNDFATFYRRHPNIRVVFFNGAKAEQAYRRYVLPHLPEDLSHLLLQRLPSTSPANTRFTLQAKAEKWEVVHDHAEPPEKPFG